MRSELLGAIVLVGTLTAGCSSNSAPPAGTEQGSPTSRASLVVPAISNPLDASRFRDTPCDLITEQQAGELGLPFAEEERTGSRVACTWRADKNDPNPLEALSIRIQTEGLAAIARQCSNRTECDSWTVDTISEYPVIRANSRLESKYGFCRMFVGVADKVAFMVVDGDLDAIQKGATEGDAGGPRCDRADRAATMVIQKLKGGG